MNKDGDKENQKIYANGIKMIGQDISDARSSSTMKSKSYDLNSKRRLLIRLEQMLYKSKHSIVNDENPMYFVISSKDFKNSKEKFENSIEICPIKTNWMMLATWKKNHPFTGKRSKWNKPGGDYETSECITPDKSYPDQDEESLYFDVSQWYVFYVKSKQRNYGLLLKTDVEFRMYGDESSTYAPYFTWVGY